MDLFAFFAFNAMVAPIYVVYLLQVGYSATEVAFLHVLKDVAVLILQVPSGVFADLFRYKHSLVISTILYFVAMASFLAVSNPIVVGFGFIAWGAALAFLNGADEGYMYRINASREGYVETSVRYGIVIRLGWFVSWAIGSVIFAVSALACFIASSVLSLIGLGTAVILPKDTPHHENGDSPEPKPSFSARDVLHLLPFALFSVAIQIMMIYQQVKLVQDGLPVGMMGLVFSLFLLGGILGSYIFKRMQWSSYRAVLTVSNIALLITLILLGWHLPALLLAAIMTAQSFVNAVMRVANSLEVNEAYRGQGVASLFSVQTMLASLIKIPTLALFGLLVDRISLEFAFQVLIVPCLCSVVLVLFYRSRTGAYSTRQAA